MENDGHGNIIREKVSNEKYQPSLSSFESLKGKDSFDRGKRRPGQTFEKEGFKKVRKSKDSPMWTSYASETMLIIVQIFQHPITSPSSNYRIKTEYAKNYKDFIYAVVACSDALGKLFVVD